MTILRPENQRTPVSIHNAQSENGKRKTRIVIREVVISRLESERGFQLPSIHDFVLDIGNQATFQTKCTKGQRKTSNSH